jgi:hypothetical protein
MGAHVSLTDLPMWKALQVPTGIALSEKDPQARITVARAECQA